MDRLIPSRESGVGLLMVESIVDRCRLLSAEHIYIFTCMCMSARVMASRSQTRLASTMSEKIPNRKKRYLSTKSMHLSDTDARFATWLLRLLVA